MIIFHYLILMAFTVCLVSAAASSDSFPSILRTLSEAPCVELEFVAVIESDVFGSIDSTEGSASLARDGRFRAQLGAETYWQDSLHLYSYSIETNQVIVEKVKPADGTDAWPLLTRLDSLYTSEVIRADYRYRLRRRVGVEADIPDSMIVTIDSTTSMIVQLSFFDINGELNRILIQKQTTDGPCDPERFKPDYPDSADVVRMY
ncbi:MAG: outer membrane lipoprotein carrier protein LolA [bacterium]